MQNASVSSVRRSSRCGLTFDVFVFTPREQLGFFFSSQTAVTQRCQSSHHTDTDRNLNYLWNFRLHSQLVRDAWHWFYICHICNHYKTKYTRQPSTPMLQWHSKHSHYSFIKCVTNMLFNLIKQHKFTYLQFRNLPGKFVLYLH